MITLEKHFQAKFGPWIKKEKIKGLYELKISHGNTVTWMCFREQQLPSLWLAYTEGLYYKLSDASLGCKPMDCFFYKGDTYVGVMYNIPINQKDFYLIHIKEVMKIKESGAKSITKKDCQKYGVKFSF